MAGQQPYYIQNIYIFLSECGRTRTANAGVHTNRIKMVADQVTYVCILYVFNYTVVKINTMWYERRNDDINVPQNQNTFP